MRDMLDGGQPYPLTAWSAQFRAPPRRPGRCAAREQDRWRRRAGRRISSAIWRIRSHSSGTRSNRCSISRGSGQDDEARDRSECRCRPARRRSARPSRGCSSRTTRREEQTAQRVAEIYGAVQRQVYWFLTATLVAIVADQRVLIRVEPAAVRGARRRCRTQRHELAQKLIATREATLRAYLARAARRVRTGADRDGLDARARRQAGAGRVAAAGPSCAKSPRSRRRSSTSVRSLSQTLHPSILEQAGLESTIDWYLSTVERQTGHRRLLRARRPARSPSMDDRRPFTSIACCRRR